MADFADMASELTDLQIEEALQKQKEAARIERSRMPFIGKCYNCDEHIGESAHFCDAGCREDWTRREFINKRISPQMQDLEVEYEDE